MDKNYAINIGRQFGSGGLLIGKETAKQLGINFYDKALINMAAKESGLSQEVFDKLDEKKALSFFHDISGWVANIFGSIRNENVLGNDALFKIQSDIIKQIANKESCVFIGRCADYILRDKKRVLNIFICADIDDRIDRIASKNQIPRSEAAKLIEETDKERRKYYEFYSDKQWGCSQSYHLTINSSVLGIQKTANLICHFAKEKLEII